MKITIDIPDTTIGAVFNYVMLTKVGVKMGARLINSDEIKVNSTVKVNPTGGDEK